MKTFGIMGWRNSGKTTLMVTLLPELIKRGFLVSTIKHTHHKFEIDKPGKDSHQHRLAGAKEVLIASAGRWALIHEQSNNPEEDMEVLIARMTPVDLLLIEGYKSHHHAKLEVHRPATGKPLMCLDDASIVAVASDEILANIPVPLFDLNDTVAIADFIVGHCDLAVKPQIGGLKEH